MRHARSPTARVDEAPRGGRLELVDVGFRFPDVATDDGRCATSTSPSNRARRSRWSAPPGRASRCSPRCCRGSTTSPRARSASTASTSASCRLPALRQAVATAFEDPTLFSMSVAENLRLGRPDATRRASSAQAIDVAAARVRLRPAVRPGHPHRRAGHEPVRRSAATAFAGARDPGRARRSWCSTTRCPRSTCTPRPSVDEALRRVLRVGHRHRRRAPGVDRAARRPGRAARGRHHHPRRHARRAAGRRCREYRYLLAADDELDDGAERDCDWEDDDEPAERLRRRTATRPRRTRLGREVERAMTRRTDWRGRFDENADDDLPIDETLPRRREARALLGSLLRPYRVTVAAAGHRRRGGKRCAAVGSAAGAARHRPRHPADRRRRLRRTN